MPEMTNTSPPPSHHQVALDYARSAAAAAAQAGDRDLRDYWGWALEAAIAEQRKHQEDPS
jgi:hypothetical protein